MSAHRCFKSEGVWRCQGLDFKNEKESPYGTGKTLDEAGRKFETSLEKWLKIPHSKTL